MEDLVWVKPVAEKGRIHTHKGTPAARGDSTVLKPLKSVVHVLLGVTYEGLSPERESRCTPAPISRIDLSLAKSHSTPY